MIIYPAIDLMAGRCVRLKQGAFDQATHYSDDPAASLAQFAAAGAQWVHVVDLDGARAGAPVQHGAIAALACQAKVKLQVAGGFRTAEQVAAMIAAGVGRVVIGSLALKDPAAVRAMIERFGPDRITLALDVAMIDGQPIVAGAGWTVSSGRTLASVLGDIAEARHLLVTDIARDGMLTGPNFELMRCLVADLPDHRVQASGGVASLADLAELAAIGADGAIVGKALWEGRFTFEQAIDHGRA